MAVRGTDKIKRRVMSIDAVGNVVIRVEDDHGNFQEQDMVLEVRRDGALVVAKPKQDLLSDQEGAPDQPLDLAREARRLDQG